MRFQNVDVLFNCAGYVHQGSILDCPESEWDRSFELNVKAVYKMCKAFIPNVSAIHIWFNTQDVQT